VASIWYNGVSIDILRTVACRRRVVLDGPTYLWTEWYLHVRGVLNPQATSYISRVPADAFAIGGSLPAYTDATIRHQLMQPRKKLIYTAAGPGINPGDPPNLDVTAAVEGVGGVGGSLVILETPLPLDPDTPNFTGGVAGDRYFTDAQQGPFPTVYNVVRVDGIKTIHVEFAVMARVNECFNYYSSPAVLLSHRWTQTHDVDRDGYTRRSVRGHGIFRSDAILAKGQPDHWRAALFHPIPQNSERQNVRVVADESNCRLDYSFTDQQVSHNNVVKHVSRIEAFAVARRSQPSDVGVLKALVGAGVALGRGSAIGALSAVAGVLPFMSATVVVRCWGTRQASRKTLRNVASKVFSAKMPDPFGGANPVPGYDIDTTWTYDLMGRYVQLQGTMTVPLANPNDLTEVSLDGSKELDEIFPDLIEDDIPGVATTFDTAGRMAVKGNTCRGTWLEECVAQVLEAPCKNPPGPVSVGFAKDVPLPVPGVSVG
jgi:hypothetical protein